MLLKFLGAIVGHASTFVISTLGETTGRAIYEGMKYIYLCNKYGIDDGEGDKTPPPSFFLVKHFPIYVYRLN